MNLVTRCANLAWAAASLPAYRRFARALCRPAVVQQQILRRLLAENASSDFGRLHQFTAIRDYAGFAERVPLTTYEDLAPWIDRIRCGEKRILTAEPVTRLVPTSGSTGARKLIPFTAGLQREFNAAIGSWMVDLFRAQPGLLGGAAYWAISPALAEAEDAGSAVPIGFDDDAAYLGGLRRRLVDAVMAVPSSVRGVRDPAEFRRATLHALLRRPDLRLISVWHPTFLSVLLDDLVSCWSEFTRAVPRLRASDPRDVRSIWPHLQLVSCWIDGHAAQAAADLARRLGGVRMQAKGLLATEAFVTLPFRGAHPLAVTSHFFEFVSDTGEVHLADALQTGVSYEVVVTTSGGLWRYRLGDRVIVDGLIGRTPSLRFVERVGGVSDRRGEKLSEGFVAGVLRELFSAGPPPRFALLAPDEDETGIRYTLFVEIEGEPERSWPARLDVALRANPHYAWCRDLGQFGAPRVFRIAHGGYDTYARHAATRGQRLGDIKPAALSAESGWSRRFAGGVVANVPHAVASRR